MVIKMNECKIFLYNNYRLIIENYHLIKKIEIDEILIDSYLIMGNNLKIKRMNDYLIEISGKIHIIKTGDSCEI